MRLSRLWSDFEKEILNAPSNNIMEILYSAAMKKRYQIEHNDDVQLDDRFIIEVIKNAQKRRSNPIDQLKYIRRYDYEN